MRVFEITRASDSKTVYADDENRMHELLNQVLDLIPGESVQLTVSGVWMEPQFYDDNHAEDSWDE